MATQDTSTSTHFSGQVVTHPGPAPWTVQVPTLDHTPVQRDHSGLQASVQGPADLGLLHTALKEDKVWGPDEFNHFCWKMCGCMLMLRLPHTPALSRDITSRTELCEKLLAGGHSVKY